MYALTATPPSQSLAAVQQCYQLSDIVAIFGEYEYPSSKLFFFLEKRLATKIDQLSGALGDFWRLGCETTYRSSYLLTNHGAFMFKCYG